MEAVMNDLGEQPAAPRIVDRSVFQAELDALRVREKAHTKAGDALAAARRRLPMVAVDGTASLIGENGPVTASPSVCRYGLALHIGELLYGNIGADNRLDFTCIGPAVNLAARVEGLTTRLGRATLLSAAFAEFCGAGVEKLGEFSLAGFRAKVPVFGLADEAR
jgi:adenylate cyclase